ncbi:MFS general substrate transporter [Rhizoclosmatium globosum]|uniref:MFS general substrate transporter n=1 Tax=Rhizoclosmatium globosum TaxID=329046 RepID=A0A1Y2D0C5_9FUNG|nr:MFS general substrate transporter [Rhizoclosmatium globosum]|eukprot:ORY52055.1 MFS general substrate transporter [Rhizoclosmatium globosum]
MSVETINTIDTTAALSDSAAVLKPNSSSVVLIEEATEPPPAPDGGFEAWGTVIASFLVHFFGIGTLYTFGLFSALYSERGYGSLAIIQFVGAIGSTMLVGAGFISGRLGETFGFRTMVGVGTTLMAAALVLASFCTQIWQLMITQGFLFGFGACLCYFPSISSVSQWFDKKRSVATGIAASSTADASQNN